MTILKDLLYTISSLPQIMSVSSANKKHRKIIVFYEYTRKYNKENY